MPEIVKVQINIVCWRVMSSLLWNRKGAFITSRTVILISKALFHENASNAKRIGRTIGNEAPTSHLKAPQSLGNDSGTRKLGAVQKEVKSQNSSNVLPYMPYSLGIVPSDQHLLQSVTHGLAGQATYILMKKVIGYLSHQIFICRALVLLNSTGIIYDLEISSRLEYPCNVHI